MLALLIVRPRKEIVVLKYFAAAFKLILTQPGSGLVWQKNAVILSWSFSVKTAGRPLRELSCNISCPDCHRWVHRIIVFIWRSKKTPICFNDIPALKRDTILLRSKIRCFCFWDMVFFCFDTIAIVFWKYCDLVIILLSFF